MIAERALLASALLLLFILQSPTLASASVKTGEWVGTIEGDFTGLEDGLFAHFQRHAEFTFRVNGDGTITGSGTGSEWVVDKNCGSNNVSIDITGFIATTGEAVMTFEIMPDEYQVYCGYPMHAFSSWRSFEIELDDGSSLDSGAGTRWPGPGYSQPSGTDVLTIHSAGPFDFAMSVEPTVVEVRQGERAEWMVNVVLLSGVPQEVSIDRIWINGDGSTEKKEGFISITPTDSFTPHLDTTCNFAPIPFTGRYEARTPQGQLRYAEFTINVLSNPDCPPPLEPIDTDDDGIPDPDDPCPLNSQAETGSADPSGCPSTSSVLVQGPIISGDGLLALDAGNPDGWHTRWETKEGVVDYQTCRVSEGHRWCVAERIFPNSVFQAKQCVGTGKGTYGYCTVEGDQRTTSTDVWLVTGQIHIASNVQPIQPIGSSGGVSADTGVVISYGKYTAALKGTEVIAEAKEDGSATLTVIEGQADVWQTDRPNEVRTIVAGQQLAARPGQLLPTPVGANSAFLQSIDRLEARDPSVVLPDPGFVTAVAVLGTVSFIGVIGAVVVGIYFVKKRREKKKYLYVRDAENESAKANMASEKTSEIAPVELHFNAPEIDIAYKNALIGISEIPDAEIVDKHVDAYIKAKTGNHFKARTKGFAMCNLRDLPTEVFIDFGKGRITVKDATGVGIKWGVTGRIRSNMTEIADELKRKIEDSR